MRFSHRHACCYYCGCFGAATLQMQAHRTLANDWGAALHMNHARCLPPLHPRCTHSALLQRATGNCQRARLSADSCRISAAPWTSGVDSQPSTSCRHHSSARSLALITLEHSSSNAGGSRHWPPQSAAPSLATSARSALASFVCAVACLLSVSGGADASIPLSQVPRSPAFDAVTASPAAAGFAPPGRSRTPTPQESVASQAAKVQSQSFLCSKPCHSCVYAQCTDDGCSAMPAFMMPAAPVCRITSSQPRIASMRNTMLLASVMCRPCGN